MVGVRVGVCVGGWACAGAGGRLLGWRLLCGGAGTGACSTAGPRAGPGPWDGGCSAAEVGEDGEAVYDCSGNPRLGHRSPSQQVHQNSLHLRLLLSASMPLHMPTCCRPPACPSHAHAARRAGLID